MMVEDTLRDVFAEMVVLKDPARSEFFSNLSLPSYMRDWLVMKFSDEDGVVDYDSVGNYIQRFIPTANDFEQFKYRMINGETVSFLARTRVVVNVKTGRTEFELPDFGGTRSGAGGIVDSVVIEKWQDTLLKESENWGIIQLDWRQDGEGNRPKGCIHMVGYKPFCPYVVDLDFYREARKNFNIHEWIDVLLMAIDYNPAGYVNDLGEIDETKKLYFLRRLLPFVENRINLIELAPRGTGKSYVYEKISKRGWLISGGTVSRAALIYDNAKKSGGLLTRFDFVGFDESQHIKFDQPNVIASALTSYMEGGDVKGFDANLSANAGVIVLGNIDPDKFNTEKNMVAGINQVFQSSEILDRFHGFIPGWEIPRMKNNMIATGWALNTEYFAEVMHALRDDISYATVIENCIDYPANADQRDLKAIKRLSTAFLKLLFPNVQHKEDISEEDFVHYCLEPAMSMRQIIRNQLRIVNPKEYDVEGKRYVPQMSYKY